jgi:hypothetical protein
MCTAHEIIVKAHGLEFSDRVTDFDCADLRPVNATILPKSLRGSVRPHNPGDSNRRD